MKFDYCTTDDEIIDSFLHNIPVCDCGSQMIVDDPRDVYICPACGHEIRQEEYDCTHPYLGVIKPYCATWYDINGADEYDYEYGEFYTGYDSELPPGRCSLCGDCKNPDYPNCLSMCEIIANL